MAPMQTKITLNKAEVQLLVETHELDVLMDNEEEAELLEKHNPDLYDLYHKLVFTPLAGD